MGGILELCHICDKPVELIGPRGRAAVQQLERHIGCPYCGETILVLIDDSLPEQAYVEDCQVCCRPIVLSVEVENDGAIAVSARAENE